MAKGYVRESHESIPGNQSNSPTLATKKLFPRAMSWEPDPGVGHLMRDDELINTDEPVEMLTENYDPKWVSNGRMYPDELGYWLTEMLGLPVTTAGNGIITDPDAVVIPTGCYRHVWTAPYGPSGAFPKTFQADVAYSDPEAVFFKAKGCATEQFEISNPAQGGVLVKRSGPILFFDEQTDPALTPAYTADTIPPFLRSHITLTWLANSASSKDFALTVQQPLTVEHTVGSGSKWPNEVYKGDSPIVVFGSIPKNLLDIDDFRALRDATKFAAKSKWQSTLVIAAGYFYSFWTELPNCQYTDGAPDPLDNKRRRGQNLNFKGIRSGSSASSILTLVNATASYV